MSEKEVVEATPKKASNDVEIWSFIGGLLTAPIIAAVVFVFCWLCFCCFILMLGALS